MYFLYYSVTLYQFILVTGLLVFKFDKWHRFSSKYLDSSIDHRTYLLIFSIFIYLTEKLRSILPRCVCVYTYMYAFVRVYVWWVYLHTFVYVSGKMMSLSGTCNIKSHFILCYLCESLNTSLAEISLCRF